MKTWISYCTCCQPKLNTAGDLAANGDVKEAGLEAEPEGAVKDADKKQTVTGELKKLQFYGAGPKAAIPEVLDPGNDAAVTMDIYSSGYHTCHGCN